MKAFIESIAFSGLILFVAYKLYTESTKMFGRNPDTTLTPQELEKYGDEHCMTDNSGDCVSTHPNCMHQSR